MLPAAALAALLCARERCRKVVVEHDDGAAPGFVGLGGESLDAVHQHCAKERGRRAYPGHLHWLNRGAAFGA